MRSVHVCLLLSMAACTGGSISEALSPEPGALTRTEVGLELADALGFSDEAGGGVFLDPNGEPVRVRLDGTKGALEPHPGNPVEMGQAAAIWPLGAHRALVVAGAEAFVAEAGWLTSPSWRGALDPSALIATAPSPDGAWWLAHRDGLFRLEGENLSQLSVGGARIEGLTAIASAPGEDGAAGVWFAQKDRLSFGAQRSRTTFEVQPATLPGDALTGGVVDLAALAPSPSSPGELWLTTPTALWRLAQGLWTRYRLDATPYRLMGAGRVLWLVVGDDLLRFDGDAGKWMRVEDLSERPRLLAVDASGAAWVRLGGATICLTPGRMPRLWGLDQNQRLLEPEATVRALPPPGPLPDEVVFTLGNGERVIAPEPLFSLGGAEEDGSLRPYSFAGLPAGIHTLTATARFPGGGDATRVIHFELPGGGELSFAVDVLPIYDARCAKCHAGPGPGRDLSGYEQWKANAELISAAIRDRRMPADGPLDPALAQKIQRWVAGGAQP